MFCSLCGSKQSDEGRSCTECGAAMVAPGRPAAVKPKKKMSGCMLAALIAGGVAVLAVPLGIIAAIAIPNFLNAVDRGKQKRTMVDLRSLGTAIEGYAYEHNVYPTANDIEELGQLISPEFITDAPTADGWERPIQAVSTPDGYRLFSTGKDGAADGCRGGAQTDFDADICFEDGQFTQWPEGHQR